MGVVTFARIIISRLHQQGIYMDVVANTKRVRQQLSIPMSGFNASNTQPSVRSYFKESFL